MRANDLVTATWYTPKSEEGSEQPTRFKLRGLTGVEFIDVQSKVAKNDDGNFVITADAMRVSLRYGLTDWEAFVDSSGKDLAFSGNQKDNIDRLPFKTIIELSDEIMARTQLDDEIKKK